MKCRRRAEAVLTAATLLFIPWIFACAQTDFTADQISIPISPNREDVKAIGMGKAQIADGRMFNAMMYNPALLSNRRVSYDVVGVQASLPTSTFNAISFLSDGNTITQFKTGDFLKQIRLGLTEYVNALGGNTPGDAAARLDGIRKINTGMKFVNDLQNNVIGTSENPKIQGLAVIPNIQVQVDNWGFSLYGILQTGFVSFPTEAESRLYAIQLPEDLTQLTNQQITDIANGILPLFDQNGNLRYQQAIPMTFSATYLDIVGSIGYAHDFTRRLSVGANLKVVNRRVATKLISSENYNQILSEVRSDLNTSSTGVTLDLGGIYRFPRINTQVGLVMQNIIPMPKINTSAVLKTVVYQATQDITNPIVAVPVSVTLPFEFSTPFLLNAGVMHAITPNWDAAFDWVDIASQDDKYETYIERFRLGTEYRLAVAPNSFGAAFRIGVADKRFAGGLGLNFWRVVQLDGAYAYDEFIGDYSYYAQIKIGW